MITYDVNTFYKDFTLQKSYENDKKRELSKLTSTPSFNQMCNILLAGDFLVTCNARMCRFAAKQCGEVTADTKCFSITTSGVIALGRASGTFRR